MTVKSLDGRPIAMTLGDPAGIGPEVAARLVAGGSLEGRLLLVGGAWALRKGAQAAGVALPDLEVVDDPDALRAEIGLVDLGGEPESFRFGEVSAACGALAVGAVERAAQMCLAGKAAAMVTCPINKAAVHAAGYTDDIGHQEILARLAGAPWTATMLMTPGLKVVHLSTHKSLIEAARFVTRRNVEEKLALLSDTLGRWGLRDARIAVAALNPHGGEQGLLGREELDEIAPAVAAARAGGIDAVGPLPADSVFNRAIDGEFDVVLAMYHDQGHIAIKVHNFHQSTTATLGIPFVRTSVDHGTAFDIAGAGRADERSLVAALDAARALSQGQLARL
ncbi:MAG: 4-hydroxythreonine-4-phosphate dehydrogenase PdxA [Pseudomonadales bacterium]|nr:4-hydroxythreonine-4-phosphate dehydrogenase PdxA [Pseudomonadales bacterium]NIX08639.1 4-hydroxythreonine-4-phosphate dehydrogenase PdxA [Pseudomonadales bacterium]